MKKKTKKKRKKNSVTASRQTSRVRGFPYFLSRSLEIENENSEWINSLGVPLGNEFFSDFLSRVFHPSCSVKKLGNAAALRERKKKNKQNKILFISETFSRASRLYFLFNTRSSLSFLAPSKWIDQFVEQALVVVRLRRTSRLKFSGVWRLSLSHSRSSPKRINRAVRKVFQTFGGQLFFFLSYGLIRVCKCL